MTRKSGSADLPLHGGHVPKWLADRMTSLGAVIAQTMIYHYGRDEFLRRLAHPFWFQSFGAVMGMDWHSSGITTSVMGALKRGLNPLQHELGIFVCGGRGKHSLQTPHELIAVGERTGLDGNELADASRLVAKIDSAAIQDGFQLYLHGFIVTADGNWTIVQQGLNDQRGQARRYHWLSEGLKDFLDEPHSAIEGQQQGQIINLTDHRAASSKKSQIDLLASLGPDGITRELIKLNVDQHKQGARVSNEIEQQGFLPHLVMPAHHDVRSSDVVTKRLHGNLAAAADRAPTDFKELLMTPNVGARTVKALAMVAEVVHGAPCRFSDPGRFSLAHGGKDRSPFPVPTKVYDETIQLIKSAVQKAKLGQTEELAALQRLDLQSRRLEKHAKGPSLKEFIADELDKSYLYGGRSIFGWEPMPQQRKTIPYVAKTEKARQ